MRAYAEPSPSNRCNKCGGELRLKDIEPVNRAIGVNGQLLVCINCGDEHLYVLSNTQKR
jgi:uncharacterized protein with PIN domain